jgi:REP element-mobilizing transposase RayT
MNRGYDGKAIFSGSIEKQIFIELLEKCASDLRIRLLAYCIMDSHYHLILENSSGHMSDFFKKLNGQYGSFYRKKNGGRGYVFQDRYKSMLIQDDSYLMVSISYVLNNPVKAGLCDNFMDYKWSSSSLYFSGRKSRIVDTDFVEEIYERKENLINLVPGMYCDELPTIKTRVGRIIGGHEFSIKALKKFDRRSGKESLKNKRINDKYFEPVEKIFQEFEKKYGMKIEEIDTAKYLGKRLRGELLVYLKDRAGLKYSEICDFPLFENLRMNSLGKLFQSAKLRLKFENYKVKK